MNCEAYHEWISADLDGRADEMTARVRQHLEECPGCRAFRDEIVRARALLRERLRPESAPAGLAARILARIEEEEAAAHRRRVLRFGLGATAAALAAAVLVLVAIPKSGARVEEIYERALAGDLPLDLRTASAEELESFYRHRLEPVRSHVVDLGAAGFRLRGGAVVTAGGRQLRLTVYDDGVHVVVCDFRRLSEYPGELPRTEEPVFLHRGELNFCIRRMGDHVCILATRMPLQLFQARMAVYTTRG